jgi:predicted SnoaL-like aldol condensation-catalyzing enzyme
MPYSSEGRRSLLNMEKLTGIDIFRLDENGKVIEYWDVLQLITGESQKDNGLF